MDFFSYNYCLYYHQFTYDSQLYVSFQLNRCENLDHILAHIKLCILDIKTLMSSHGLCLNDGKTDVVVLSPPANSHRFSLSEVPDWSVAVSLGHHY